MTVTDGSPAAAPPLDRLAEIRARHAAQFVVIEPEPDIVRIRAQLGLPPARARRVPVEPTRPVLGPEDEWERELHRKAIARQRAGKPVRVSRKLIPTPLPVPVRVWWPVRPPACRAAVRRPMNGARRAVVACWPVADQRDHARALTTALWALGAVLAAVVALGLVVVAVTVLAVLTGPWRAVRAVLARYRQRKLRKAWEDWWRREQSYYVPPVTAAQRQRRYRMTWAGAVMTMILACGGFFLLMGACITVGATRLEQHRAETGQVQP